MTLQTAVPSVPCAAARWHARLAKFGGRAGLALSDLTAAARRAPALDDTERRAILRSLLDLAEGAVVCPACAHRGAATNGHHRFAKIRLTCRACAHTYPATEAR